MIRRRGLERPEEVIIDVVDPGASSAYSYLVPLETVDRSLFRTRPSFSCQLGKLVGTIVGQQRPGGMCYALQGSWGSGKSTALAFVREEVQGEAQRRGESVLTENLEATLWEGRVPARAVVALAVATAVDPGQGSDGGGKDTRFTRFTRLTDPTDGGSSVLERAVRAFERASGRPGEILATVPDGGDSDLVLRLRFLRAFGRGTPFGPAFEDWLIDHLDDRRRLVLVDDLDRCGLEFTAEVLEAISFWTLRGQGWVQFVIAAERDHLRRSMACLPVFRDQPELSAESFDTALQKYVQVHVDVPPYFGDHREVAAYVGELLKLVGFPDVVPEMVAALHRLVEEAAERYPDGSLAPLLRAQPGLTPRYAKERLNAFLSDFNPVGESRLDEFEVETKRRVISALWPESWWRLIAPAEIDDSDSENGGATSLVEAIVHAAEGLYRSLWNAPEEGVLQALRSAAGVHSPLLDNVDAYLALYLAAEPRWRRPRPDRIRSLEAFHASPSSETERPRAPQARRDSLRGGDSSARAAAIGEAVGRVRKGRNLDDLVADLQLLIELEGYRELLRAGSVVVNAADTDEQRYTILRLVADGAAVSDDVEVEAIAADIYRFILDRNLVRADPAGPDQGELAVRHNLASLLVLIGRTRSDGNLRQHALKQWQWLYDSGRCDDAAGRSFARALNDAGHESDALSVLKGERLTAPIEEPVASLGDLAASADRWWEKLSLTMAGPDGDSSGEPSSPQTPGGGGPVRDVMGSDGSFDGEKWVNDEDGEDPGRP